MKKLLLLSLILGLQHAVFAQVNLVPNPSFEDTVACPVSANQLNRAVGWESSGGSPDYFNECDWLTGTAAVPNNFIGYQYANNGVAYCGAILFDTNDPNYRERFTCQLISNLVTGKKYLIDFYVSWAGTWSKRLACNKIGALFSTINYNLTSPSPINNYCQFYSDSIISDSLNWVHINGSFISDSNYSHLTIGAFFDDMQTDTILLNPSSQAYYYIDDVTVTEDTNTSVSDNLSSVKLLKIFPNPVDNHLKINSKNNKIIKIEILTCNVTIIMQINNLTENEIDIDVSKIANGIYYLKVFFSDDTISYHKFIKSK